MSTIILRLKCEIGLYRIEIDKNKKLIDLKHKIEDILEVPPEKQQLFLNENPNVLLNSDFTILSEYKIQNGDRILLKSDVKPTKRSNNSMNSYNNSSCNNNSYNINNNNNSESNKNDANTPNNNDKIKKETDSKENDKNNKPEPNFKSFDYFLKLRGYNTTDLPLSLTHNSIYLEKGKFIKIPLSITLKHQEYRHVDHLELMNVEEVKNFVHYWYYNNNMIEQRGGWMYGYYKEDSHYNLGIRAVCECIYEPPQINENNKIKFLPDDSLESVDLIAERLGLERIGWIFTHLPRKEYLTSDEVVQIAKIQLNTMKKNMHYTNYSISNFITCTISPDPLLSNEPVTNAFMISDLGMALIRDNFIEENQPDSSLIQLRKPNPNELLPQILEGGKETNKFDTDWFIVRVNESAPKVVRSIFKNFHFSRENRAIPQSVDDIKEYFRSNKLDRQANVNFKCSDFHLILFVSKILDIETAFALCDATLNKKEIDPIIEVLTSIKI